VYGPPSPPPRPTPQPAPKPYANPNNKPQAPVYGRRPGEDAPSSTGPQNRRVNGSQQKQKVIDTFPSFDDLRQSLMDEGEWPDDAETQQKLASLYHAKVTQRSTSYKSADPNRRAMMDARISQTIGGGELQVPAVPADLLDERMTSEGPVSNVVMNVVNQSPIGQGYKAITGQDRFRTREAQGGAEQTAETIGNIGTSLATFGGAAGMTTKAAAAAGLSPWLSTVLPGMAGTLANSIPQNAAAVRSGQMDLGQGALNVGVDALAGGLLGPLSQLIPGNTAMQAFNRNAAQTGVQTAADLSKGVLPNAQDLAINIGSGAMLDVMGNRPKMASIEDELTPPPPMPEQAQGPTQPLSLPPGRGTNQGSRPLLNAGDPMVEAWQTGVADNYDLPEITPKPKPVETQQIPARTTGAPDFYAPAGPKPAPRLEPTIPERITALDAQAQRYREALSRRGGKPERREKIKQVLAQTERQIFDLQQEYLRANPPAYTPESVGVKRDIAEQVAEQKALRDYGYTKIDAANEAGIETDGGLINERTDVKRIRMMSNDQLREQLNKLAPTDTKETFAEGVASVASARDELGRLNDPNTPAEVARQYTEMDRAMPRPAPEQSPTMRQGATPIDASTTSPDTVRQLADRDADLLPGVSPIKRQEYREIADSIIPADVPLKRVELGLGGADEQMRGIRAEGDRVRAEQQALDDDIPDFDDPRFSNPNTADDGLTYLRSGLTGEDMVKGVQQGAEIAGKASRAFDAGAIRIINAVGRRLGAADDLIDNTGTLVAGKEMMDNAAEYLRSKKQGALADKISAAVVDDYALPENYRQIRDQYRQTQDTIARQFVKAHEEQLAGLSDAEQTIVYDVLTNENAAPGAYQSMRQELRDLVDTMGQRAVDAGVISQESFDRNKGQYLSRSYAEHELGDKGGKGIGRLGRAIKFATNSMKGRGVSKSVADSTLARLQQTGTNPKTGKPQYEINGETWELRAPGVLWRDWNKAERVQMGELEDASYAFLKTGHQLSRNIATGEFYRDLAKDESIAKLAADEDEAAELAKAGWQLVGGNAQGTNRPKWGALDGHYVQPDIHRDLTEIQRMQTSTVWKELLTQWKLNKTARNPVVHMNNVMSNFSLLELNGGNADDVFTAGRIMAGKGDAKQSAMYERAQELGVFGSVHDELGTQMRSMLKDIGAVRAGMTLPEKAWHFIKGLDQKMLNAYGAEDGLFRFALYMNDVKNGMTPEAAAKRAKTAFVDYNITAPAINAARNSVLPFIGYAYRALPLLARGIAERPWKAAKIALAWQGANALFSAMAGGNEDEERASMSGQVRNAPFMMRMPITDSRGQARYLDTTKYIPGADILGGINEAMRTGDAGEAIKGVGNTFSMGGPMLDAYNLMKNQKPDAPPGLDTIWNENTPKSRQWKDAGKFVYESLMPNNPVIPGTYSGNKVGSAIMGKPDAYGRQDTVPGAIMSTLGVKTRPVDVKELQDKRRAKAEREENDARRVISSARSKYRRGGLSKAEFEEIRDEQAGVIKAVRQQFKEYRDGVKAAR
jgi:hypothetical protein